MDIIGLQGSSPGAGKDTVYEIIKEYAESKGKTVKRIAFGDQVKILALRSLGFEGEDAVLLELADRLKRNGDIELSNYWKGDEYNNILKELTVREYIQNFGQAMKTIDLNIWVNLADKSIKEFKDVIIFTDIRFKVEAEYVAEWLNQKIFYIDAKQRVKQDKNKEVEGWYDDKFITKSIDNNGSKIQLREQVIETLKDTYDW